MTRQDLGGVSLLPLFLAPIFSPMLWLGVGLRLVWNPQLTPHCGSLYCVFRYNYDVVIFNVLLHHLKKNSKVQGETQLSVTSAIRIKNSIRKWR